MKKLYNFITAIMFLAACTVTAQCPTGDISLGTQAEVNAFAANYPDCTEIPGNLDIGGSNSNITNLGPLSNLTSVGGRLRIFNSQLQNLTALSNLTSIGSYLWIVNNNLLTDISGLSNIDPATIGGTYGLYITNNPVLSVCNLPNFCTYTSYPVNTHPRTINGNAGNCLNETVMAMSCSQECPGNLVLSTQAEVNAFPVNFPDCTEITGSLVINGSDITDLSPLSNVTSIGGTLYIYNNPQLENLTGLDNITNVGGYLYIRLNPQLLNVNDLNSLTSIGSYLSIIDNALLENLNGLNNLTSINGYFAINSNPKLQNLDALSNLTSINGELYIYNNNLLTDISGLANIDPATISGYDGLYITNNPVLSVCNLSNLCTYISNPPSTHPRTISGNAANCITEAAMGLACSIPCPTNNIYLKTQAEVNAFGVNYPDCTEITGNLYIGNSDSPDGWNIPGSNITNLNGLSNITSVAGSITIEYNHQLQNLNGLNNLTNIEGSFIIRDNNQFQSFSALSNLESIAGNFNISNNDVLQNLNGLSNLANIGGGLSISINDHLQSVSGLSALINIGGTLVFYNNEILQNVNGLSALTSIGGLDITANDMLQNINGLSNITNIGGGIRILSNSALQNINGLSNVTSINGDLLISSNSHIQNLNGLSNVTSINGSLQVANNNLLTDISGLTNIDPATIGGEYGLVIANNPVLTVCNLPNLCTYLSYPYNTHPRTINNNAQECINEAAMGAACSIPCLTGDLTLRTQAEVNAFGANYPDCTEVPGNLVIGSENSSYSNITDLSPLSHITSVGGYLYIRRTSQLQNLDGLNNITNLGGYLYIFYNTQLQNLDGLSNITGIGGYLLVGYNNSLADISGLSNIDPTTIFPIGSTYGLYIANNPVLSVCDLPNLCSYLSYPSDTHSRLITANAGDCISEAAVALACDTGDSPYNETQEEYGDTIQEAVELSDCDVESVVIIPPGNYGTETVDATDPCYDILFKIGVAPGSAFIGSYSIDDSDTVEIEIGGASTLDKYVILNTLSLGGATLDIKFMNDFLPVQGDSWVIFDNTFSGAVNGTFAGLGEGNTFIAQGYEFQISYTGGDGNDISVTVTGCPELLANNLPSDQEGDIVEGTCQAFFGWTEPSFEGGCGALTVTRTISPYPQLPPIAYGPGNNVGAGVKSGVTTVTYTVTDEMNNTEEFSFTLTANDVEAPEINCPGDITVDAEPGLCGAEVTYTNPVAEETPCNMTSPKHLAKNSETVGTAMDCLGVVSQHLQIYDLAAEGVETDYQLNNVTVGIFHSDGSLSYLSVNLYFEDQLTESFTSYSGPISNTVTPYASITAYMPPGDNYLFNVPLSVLIPAGSKVYVEVVTSLYGDYLLGYTSDGSNDDQGYISCGSDSYASLEYLGYPDMSPIISLDGEEYNVITPVQTEGLPSGSVFPVGTTTNTFEVTSANGITSTCSFDVVVEDNELPVITCPVPDESYGTDAGECSATLSFTATATDNCSAEITYSLDEEETEPIDFPYEFPLGTTIIYATAEDPSGNKSQCEFDVTVVSSQLPEILCAANQLAEADMGVCTFTHNGTDWDATVALDCNIASIIYELNGATTGNGTSLNGMTFNTGDTTVTWTVTDNDGNTASCSFIVTVEDNQSPEITCIANQSVDSDTGVCTYTHTGTSWDAAATDNCNITSVTYELSGATTGNGTSLNGVEFNLGETVITWTATDNAGNINTCSFTITVEDNIAPEITCTVNQEVDVTTNECSYIHSGTTWDAVATDNCNIASVNYELSGATTGNGTSLDDVEFNLGETIVIWTVTDNAGNTNSCSFTVTVEDSVAPEITCTVNQEVDVTTNECSYIHSGTAWDAVATDNCSIATLNYELTGATTGTGTSLDGVEFNIGETTVTWTVTDNAGNTSSCSFTVMVEDNQAPTAICAEPFTVQLDENGEAIITVEDVDDGSFDSCGNVSLEISQDAFDCSNIGENAVTLTVTDTNGNTSSCTTTITVEDNIAPEIFCPDDLEVSVAAGESYVLPDYFADGDASATDNCSVTVSQNPEPGTELEAGMHTIILTAVDQSGNEVSCSFGIDVHLGIKSYEMNSLTMYPNPARSTVTIGNPQLIRIEKIIIYDLQGRLIRQITPENKNADVPINIRDLSTGSYLVNIVSDKGERIVKKLIKR